MGADTGAQGEKEHPVLTACRQTFLNTSAAHMPFLLKLPCILLHLDISLL